MRLATQRNALIRSPGWICYSLAIDMIEVSSNGLRRRDATTSTTFSIFGSLGREINSLYADSTLKNELWCYTKVGQCDSLISFNGPNNSVLTVGTDFCAAAPHLEERPVNILIHHIFLGRLISISCGEDAGWGFHIYV